MATFDYLDGQVYVPVGLLDNADALEPSLHTHCGSQLPWLSITDDLPRVQGSGRKCLARTGS